jgi:hypothetical protein
MSARALLLTLLFGAAAAGAAAPIPAQAPTQTDVAAAIDRLGSLESFEVRMEAARTVRRAALAQAVPALTAAARRHDDEYVRYRALVLLAGFGQPATGSVMRELMADRNDRIRAGVYGWFEHHPDPDVVPRLLEALAAERSEFVRPALTRALAAHDHPRVREALLPFVDRGEDFFRGATIEALGEYRRVWALPAIEAVARLEGPLQDDAISAIGRMGDRTRQTTLAELQRSVARELQPSVSAALCLLEVNCESHVRFLADTVAFAAKSDGEQALLRGAVHALGMLAVRGRAEALRMLIETGVPAQESVRAPVALGVGLVALRNPTVVLEVLGAMPARDEPILLLRDAFDMLNEDFEEERFYVTVRRHYWAAAEGSAGRDVAEALIRMLEF